MRKTFCRIGGCKHTTRALCCCECPLPPEKKAACEDRCLNDVSLCGLAYQSFTKRRRVTRQKSPQEKPV